MQFFEVKIISRPLNLQIEIINAINNEHEARFLILQLAHNKETWLDDPNNEKILHLGQRNHKI